MKRHILVLHITIESDFWKQFSCTAEFSSIITAVGMRLNYRWQIFVDTRKLRDKYRDATGMLLVNMVSERTIHFRNALARI